MSRMSRNLKNQIFPEKSEIVALQEHRFCRILTCFKKHSRHQFWENNYWRDTLKFCRVRCRVCRVPVAHGIRGRGCRAMAETESPEPVDRPTYSVFYSTPFHLRDTARWSSRTCKNFGYSSSACRKSFVNSIGDSATLPKIWKVHQLQ